MKTVGLIGGMSWKSTQHYYQIMNECVQDCLGGHNSIEAIMYSVNFARILDLADKNAWELISQEMIKLAQNLEEAGADFLAIACNTVHKVFPEIQEAITIPILHILDPVGKEIRSNNLKKVAILGTKRTLKEDFYRERLEELYGIEVIIPDESELGFLEKIIFEELSVGKIDPVSSQSLIKLVNRLSDRGAQGMVLGCTELGLLINQTDATVPLFDTALLHAQACVKLACQDEFKSP